MIALNLQLGLSAFSRIPPQMERILPPRQWFLRHNSLAIIELGLTVVKDYYFKIGPAVALFYRAYEYNILIWTLGRRNFGEYGPICNNSALAVPFLADLLTYVAPSVFLIFGLLGSESKTV